MNMHVVHDSTDVCECGALECTAKVRLSPGDESQVKAAKARAQVTVRKHGKGAVFVVSPQCYATNVDMQSHDTVLAENTRFVAVLCY